MNNEELARALESLGFQIGANNQLLLQNVQAMMQKAEIQNRKKRRKKIGEVLLASPGSFLKVGRIYDDGYIEAPDLTHNLTGRYAVYILDFHGREKSEMFGIFFENEDVWVVGNKKSITPEYLLNRFVICTGLLNPEIPRSVAGRILFDFFAVQIEKTKKKKVIPILAGWNNEGEFLYDENFEFCVGKEVPDLPVLNKKFPKVVLTREIIEIYFEEIRKIIDWKNRLIIALYPFAGIMSSIFDSLGEPIDFCINFVEMGDVDRKRICSWLKVFNREFLLPISLDITDSELEKMIADTNDEVLICDANWQEEDSNYKRNKIKNYVTKIINSMKKQGNSQNDKKIDSCFSCAFFSRYKILKRGVLNIWADKELCQKKDINSFAFLEKQVMESVLSDFVIYVKNNLETIWEIIIKIRKESEKNANILSVVFEIYSRYWRKKGMEIQQVLKLPEEIIWDEIFCNSIDEEDGIMEEFIRTVRKNIANYFAIKKGKMAEFRYDAIYFTDDFLWIPTHVFNEILEKERISMYRNDILILLKENKWILADENGYSRKLIVSKTQFEAYKIRISVFNKLGMTHILDLTRRK